MPDCVDFHLIEVEQPQLVLIPTGSEVIKEWMHQRSEACKPFPWAVSQAANEEVQYHRVFGSENHFKRSNLDCWEVVLLQLRVHRLQLVNRGRPQHLDDLNQLIDRGLTWEQRLSDDHFGNDTGEAPDIDDRGVEPGTKHQLRGPVVPRADVSDVGLVRIEAFR